MVPKSQAPNANSYGPQKGDGKGMPVLAGRYTAESGTATNLPIDQDLSEYDSSTRTQQRALFKRMRDARFLEMHRARVAEAHAASANIRLDEANATKFYRITMDVKCDGEGVGIGHCTIRVRDPSTVRLSEYTNPPRTRAAAAAALAAENALAHQAD